MESGGGGYLLGSSAVSVNLNDDELYFLGGG